MTCPFERFRRTACVAIAALCMTACSGEKPILRARASSPENAAGVALLSRGLEGPARAAFERALDDALRENDLQAEVDARLNLSLVALDANDNARSVHHLVLAVERMVEWGDLSTEDRAVSWVTAAELVFAVRQREAEEIFFLSAFKLGTDAGLLVALATCARGDDAASGERDAVRRFEGSERDALHVRVLRCEAHAALRRGAVDVALAYADRAIEVDRRGHDGRALREDLALGARALDHAEPKAKALFRWLEVARLDAAMAHADGLAESAAAAGLLMPFVSENDRRRAATVLSDLRERLSTSSQRDTTK